MALNIQDPTIKTMDGTKLEAVRDFKYLRAWMASTEKDMKVRKALAWRAMHTLRKVWKSNLKAEKEETLRSHSRVRSTLWIRYLNNYHNRGKILEWLLHSHAENGLKCQQAKTYEK